MSKLLDIEEGEQNLPILCIYGEERHLIEDFLKENSRKFRIIFVSNSRAEYLDLYPEIYFLTYKNASLLPKLHEQINYALLFLNTKNSVEFLSSIIEKINHDKSQTLMVTNPENFLNDLTMLQNLKDLKNIRFSLLGEILTVNRKTEGNLSKIIENAILKGEIRLEGNESLPVYAFSIHDAINGISRLMFGNYKSNLMHFIFYRHPETILESAHLFAKIEPETKILFSDNNSNNEGVSHNDLKSLALQHLGLEASYIDAAEGFDKAVLNLIHKREEVEENVINRVKHKRISKKKKSSISKAFRFAFISFFVGTFLFIFINLIFLGLGLFYLQSSVNGIRSNDFKGVATNAKTANFFLSTIKPTVELSLEGASIIDKQGRVILLFRLLQKGGELSEVAGRTFVNLFDSKVITKGQLATTLANFSYLFQEGQRLSVLKNNKSLSGELKDTYSKLLSLSEVLPIVLGFDQSQNYLLLFQNDEELRPTGGFIGSVGDLTIKNGKVEEIAIQDVYELDGQLKNHIEPPFVVRRYLQPHLYLRDSNFSLNFQESASRSALIYNLETGKKPDAVIAIDLQVLREILKLSGPIKLPAYNVTVTSDTISQFIQSTIKENFFPGSTQKRDVLNSVFTQLLQKIENDPQFYVSVIKLLPDLLENKNIQLAFSDSTIQKVFNANSYSGDYSDRRVGEAKKINDYLYINEANIGVNKVNANITRKIKYIALIGQDTLTSKATLDISNTSSTDDYTAYLTFSVPKGSVLRQISIDGKKQDIISAVTDPAIFEADTFVTPVGLETEQYIKGNHTNFAFVLKTPMGKEKSVTVEYANSSTKTLTTTGKYSLLVIKQPGIKQFGLTTTFSYPEEYVPIRSTADSYGKNFLEKTALISNDYITEFELQKKK